MAREYDDRAKHTRVYFDDAMQEVLILGCIDICRRRGWRCHVVGTDPSHFHVVVSWKRFVRWEYVRQKIKNILSLLLGRLANQPGRPWFVREGSRKRVENQKHLDHLVQKYIPDHPGRCWIEGQPFPIDRYKLLDAKVEPLYEAFALAPG